MATFDVPKTPPRSTTQVDAFYGVDFTTSIENIEPSLSPDAPNMIRDAIGTVRKCMGYELVHSFGETIYGFHVMRGAEEGFYHAGDKLYYNGNAIYSGMNRAPSKSWQVGDKLWIVDGKALISVSKTDEGYKVSLATDDAYIPLVSIAQSPKGGGTEYEAYNLLQPKFKEQFAGTKDDTVYHLRFSDLDDYIMVETMDENGVWSTKEGGYSFDKLAGTVTFDAAPGVSPVTGEDNVRITASRTVEGYADRINKCTFGTLYGVNAAADRLFLSGNPDYINYDWFSQQYDPSYFPDIAYSILGNESSAIVGYSIVSNYLAAHKDELSDERTVIIREGVLNDNRPAFPIRNTLQGPGAIASRSFSYLATEPLFLTRNGVFAITASDVSGEKYAQRRSYFIDGRLLEEPNLDKAIAVSYNDMYWLFINGVAYILDGMQSMSSAKYDPYSARQYAGFYRTNVPATAAWNNEGLWFGTEDGNVYRFYKDTESLSSYNDDGKPIECYWETPEMFGTAFYKNKTFRWLAVKLSSASATSISMYSMRKGVWSLLKNDTTSARHLLFSSVSFEKMSFSSDTTSKTIPIKTRLRRLDKVRYKFVNDQLNEPFGLASFAIEFVTGNNFKG